MSVLWKPFEGYAYLQGSITSKGDRGSQEFRFSRCSFPHTSRLRTDVRGANWQRSAVSFHRNSLDGNNRLVFLLADTAPVSAFSLLALEHIRRHQPLQRIQQTPRPNRNSSLVKSKPCGGHKVFSHARVHGNPTAQAFRDMFFTVSHNPS